MTTDTAFSLRINSKSKKEREVKVLITIYKNSEQPLKNLPFFSYQAPL